MRTSARCVCALLVCMVALFVAGGIGYAASGDDDALRDQETYGIGPPLLSAGGPDGFGYLFIDSNDAGGPTFSWVDVSGSGTLIQVGDETKHGPLNLGFTFSFYGSDYSQVWVGSNGWLTFGSADPGSSDSSNDCPLPSTNGNENLIAGIWDDLDNNTTSPDGVVYHAAFAAGGCPYSGYAGACFVVEWVGMYHYNSSPADDVTFEIVLFDNHRILVQILDAGEEAGSGSTTGIEDKDGKVGLTYACDTAGSLTDNLAVLFYLPFTLAVDHTELSACAGSAAAYGFSLTNRSETPLTFSIAHQDFNWSPSYPATVGPVAPGATASFTVNHNVPSDAQPGDWDVGKISAAVSGDPSKSSATSVTTTVACGTVYEPTLVVPGMARSTGVGGSFFKSAFWMTSTATASQTVRLRYFAAGPAGGASNTRFVTLTPGQTVAYADVLSEAFGATDNTQGTIVVELLEGEQKPMIAARTFNDSAAGTYGQYITAVEIAKVTSNEFWIHGLGGDAANRSNVGIVNLSTPKLQATVSVYDATGTQRGSDVNVTVPSRTVYQVNGVNSAAGAGSLAVFSVKVTANGPIWVYVSKLDNTTSDPIFIPGTLFARYQQWLDGIAAAPGLEGTQWRSSMSITNPGTSSATVAVTFTRRGESAPAATVNVTVAAGQSLYYTDVLQALFGLGNDLGWLALVTDPTTPVVAWARTYNDKGAGGTFGQFIPGFGKADLLGPDGGVFQGISENSTFRTNMGIINVGTQSSTVTVSVWSASGSKLGEKSYSVGAGKSLFLTKAVNAIGVASLDDGYLVVAPSSVLTTYAWASSVDNTSTDQIFVRPQLPIPFSPWEGDWVGTTSKNLGIEFHINNEGVMDSFRVQVKISMSGGTCTGYAPQLSAAPLVDDLISTRAWFPLSTIYTDVTGAIVGTDSASGSYTKYSGSWVIICGSYLEIGFSGTPLSAGTWTATKQP